jgi:hypothetical protein
MFRWMQLSYNDLVALPQAMTDSLQLRLRPARQNTAHQLLQEVAIVVAL